MPQLRHRERKDGRCNAERVDSVGAFYCWDRVEKGRTSCRRHGGKQPRGALAMKGYRLTSRFAQEELAALHRNIVATAEAARVDDDIATVELLIRRASSWMETDRAMTEKQEGRMLGLIEQKRKLVETRDRQAEKLRTMIPVEQVRSLALGMVTVIVDNVHDPETLERIQRQIGRLVRGVDPTAPVIDVTRTASRGDVVMQHAQG